MQMAALAVAGIPNYPSERWSEVSGLVTTTLFDTFPTAPTADGQRYLSIVKNLTGGERPMFAQGLAFGGSFPLAYGAFGGDGTINGIYNKAGIDTNAFTYTIDGDTAGSATINAMVQKLTALPDANRPRTDGLRWVPKANGEFLIPVVSIHTLGDLFVPFSMQQIYQRRVAAKGNSGYLVQRAIRGASHCDFTTPEQVAAFSDMIAWEAGGAKPAGDDVVTPATVAAATYGCTFTNNTPHPDTSASTNQLRAGIQATGGACPP